MAIRLQPRVVDRIAAQLRPPHELELCHALLGHIARDESIDVIEQVSRATASRGRFWVTQPDWERVQRRATESQLSIVALLHSHPSGTPYLSTADRVALHKSSIPWVVVTQALPPLFNAWGPDGTRIAVEFRGTSD